MTDIRRAVFMSEAEVNAEWAITTAGQAAGQLFVRNDMSILRRLRAGCSFAQKIISKMRLFVHTSFGSYGIIIDVTPQYII